MATRSELFIISWHKRNQQSIIKSLLLIIAAIPHFAAYTVYVLSRVPLYLWTNAMRLVAPSCSMLVSNLALFASLSFPISVMTPRQSFQPRVRPHATSPLLLASIFDSLSLRVTRAPRLETSLSAP